MKYIIKQYIDEGGFDAEWYLDDDYIKGKGGEKDAIIYCLVNNGWGNIWGFNADEYKEVCKQADYIADGFYEVREYDGGTYKEVMEYYGIKYSPKKCHDLKIWADLWDNTNGVEGIAEYLTITTGKKWAVERVNGYRDYVDVLYCEQYHSCDDAQVYGEIFLGQYSSYEVIELDDDGEEVDCCSGYVVADSQAWKKDDIKALVCEWACIPVEDTELWTISGSHTYTVYEYDYDKH